MHADALLVACCSAACPLCSNDRQLNTPSAVLQVIVTNTIPTHADCIFPELTVLSAANLLGETIWRVYNASSVQSLF